MPVTIPETPSRRERARGIRHGVLEYFGLIGEKEPDYGEPRPVRVRYGPLVWVLLGVSWLNDAHGPWMAVACAVLVGVPVTVYAIGSHRDTQWVKTAARYSEVPVMGAVFFFFMAVLLPDAAYVVWLATAAGILTAFGFGALVRRARHRTA